MYKDLIDEYNSGYTSSGYDAFDRSAVNCNIAACNDFSKAFNKNMSKISEDTLKCTLNSSGVIFYNDERDSLDGFIKDTNDSLKVRGTDIATITIEEVRKIQKELDNIKKMLRGRVVYNIPPLKEFTPEAATGKDFEAIW